MDRRLIAYTVIFLGLFALVLFEAAPDSFGTWRTAAATPAPALTTSQPPIPNPAAPAYPAASGAVAAAPIHPAGPNTAAAPPYPAIPTAAAPPAPAQAAPSAAPLYSYSVVNTYPHDPSAFTQGLVYSDGVLYEGTGLNGRSSLRQVDLASGTVVLSVSIDAEYFGEGIALLGDKIYQLTWRSNKGFVYDRASFQQIGEWSYPGEGWGLTHDGSRLIMSDGTSSIRFLDPATLTEAGRIEVRDGDMPVTQLNELEYINGQIFANIWQTDRIARIDPVSGQVTAWIDLSGLLTPEERAQANVLNGIAYDPAGERLFVTGKLWPKLFEITLVPPQAMLPHSAVLPLICRSA